MGRPHACPARSFKTTTAPLRAGFPCSMAGSTAQPLSHTPSPRVANRLHHSAKDKVLQMPRQGAAHATPATAGCPCWCCAASRGSKRSRGQCGCLAACPPVLPTWVEGVLVGACVAPHFAVQLLRLPQHVLQQGVLPAILAICCTGSRCTGASEGLDTHVQAGMIQHSHIHQRCDLLQQPASRLS